mmetsp:Transcript_40795/g.66160  ORF Transcript_40795/g.66160 Transcript_40795/m.66160 type:complete len:83 (+) Transcript_40795:570-818(+)
MISNIWPVIERLGCTVLYCSALPAGIAYHSFFFSPSIERKSLPSHPRRMHVIDMILAANLLQPSFWTTYSDLTVVGDSELRE